MSKEWFTVDKDGLAKLLERKGKAFVLYELLQNAWDTNAVEVTVTVEPIANKPFCNIEVVDDDPEGFSHLSHAYTLFAESEKKGDPSKRGRFNLGEKLVLAVCREAEIRTTKGAVGFDADGRWSSNQSASKREKGSSFKGVVRMTREEHDEVCKAARKVIAPLDKHTTFNGEELPQRTLKTFFEVTLPTEIADGEGVLRRSARKALVSIYDALEGETPMLYEMGIPVVELSGGEPWHINVQQKVPLNVDRDNVTPAYLRDIRTHTLNHMHEHVKGKEAASTTWVREAMSDERAEAPAVVAMATEAFGKNAVIYDPNDREANHKATAEGFTVIPGGSLPKGAWDNIKKHEVYKPSGKVFPTNLEAATDGEFLTDDQLTPGMKRMKQFVQNLADILINSKVTVLFFTSQEATVDAQWGSRTISFNVTSLGEKWFASGPNEKQVDLIVHEFGHHYEKNHLSESYYHALTKMAAKLAFWCSKYPDTLQGEDVEWGSK